MYLDSTQYGADQFVKTSTISGTFATDTTTQGTDAKVSINGQQAAVSGYKVSLRTENLNVDLTMTSTFASAAGSDAFSITGGGATFSISPDIGSAGQEVIGIQSVAAQKLGTTANGFLADLTTGKAHNLTTDAAGAQSIVKDAINQVASLRGRLGSFQANTIDPTVNSLGVTLENVSAAESAIRDTDFATETSNLTREQILVSAGTSVLSLANHAPQSVLNLLQ